MGNDPWSSARLCSEPPPTMPLVSTLTLAKCNAFFAALGFVTSYMLPSFQVNQIFTKKKPDAKAKEMAEYMSTFVGQHDVPFLLISLAMIYTGNVAEEYILGSTAFWVFVNLDIVFRVLGVCEKVGVGRDVIVKSLPLTAGFGFLHVMNYF